jgi:hypothetical protein
MRKKMKKSQKKQQKKRKQRKRRKSDFGRHDFERLLNILLFELRLQGHDIGCEKNLVGGDEINQLIQILIKKNMNDMKSI